MVPERRRVRIRRVGVQTGAGGPEEGRAYRENGTEARPSGAPSLFSVDVRDASGPGGDEDESSHRPVAYSIPFSVPVTTSAVIMSTSVQASPRIANVSWGTLQLEDQDRAFKDAKLYPGGARAWDWNETGTSHSPGIQPADVQELLDNGAEIVVLSRGMNERLQVKPETLRMLDDQGVETHVLQTEKAVERYNELQESDEPVGGLFHSTC